MDKVILNIKSTEDIILAARAAKYLLDRPEKPDALLAYGDGWNEPPRYYVRRNKSSISVWEQ